MDAFVRNFIARHSQKIRRTNPERLLKILSAIEYAEAIIEISASKLFGNKFKWLIVFLTHLAKCVIRLQLLVIHKIGVQTLPSLFTVKSFLDRVKQQQQQSSSSSSSSSSPSNTQTTTTIADSSTTATTLDAIVPSVGHGAPFFKLASTGRIVRSISSAPVSLDDRNWSVPDNKRAAGSLQNDKQEKGDVEFDPNTDKLRFAAEILHIVRPVTHLSSLFLLGSKSWTQLMIPLSMDLTSLFLMNGTSKLSKLQRIEMRRRAVVAIYYLIRSPFYESCSSSLINLTLSQIEQRIPGMKFIIKPVNDYIPYWRSIYNNSWTS